MNISGHSIKYFFFSQYLADGIRITLQIILPVLAGYYTNQIDAGLTMATGAFCISICEIPGPVKDKRNGMLYATGFVLLISLLTGLFNGNNVLMGGLIMISTFFFSMIGIYGNRAASVGTAALLMMIIRMSEVQPLQETLNDSLLIFAGCIWYLLASMFFNQLSPYRPSQRSLGECIHETAGYLKLKAAMYDPSADQEEITGKLLAQQVTINEKQDITRELLFKNRQITKDPSRRGRLLVLTFIHAVDLFEQITATWYDYRQIREKFAGTGILEEIAAVIRNMSEELDRIGFAIQANQSYDATFDWLTALNTLKSNIDALDETKSHFILKKILVNLRQIGELTDNIMLHFSDSNVSNNKQEQPEHDFSKFVSHQVIHPGVFVNNLSLTSASFRHALRMMITCLAGYLISLFLSYGQHGYWIVLTIIIILKPGFSLTKQRNFERITGTIAGAMLAFVLLSYIHDKTILFLLVIFFMIGTYTSQRINYIVMVIFITPYLLIVLNLLGMGFEELVRERLLDTGIAFLLAFVANYLLFPNWEVHQLKTHMANIIHANLAYLGKLNNLYSGNNIPPIEYKLARKNLFVSMANLSAAFHRMLSEPESKQQSREHIYQFVVLNQVLSSNIAGLATSDSTNAGFNHDAVILLKRIDEVLQETLLLLTEHVNRASTPGLKITRQHTGSGHSTQIRDQLDFIFNVAQDIRKVTRVIQAT